VFVVSSFGVQYVCTLRFFVHVLQGLFSYCNSQVKTPTVYYSKISSLINEWYLVNIWWKKNCTFSKLSDADPNVTWFIIPVPWRFGRLVLPSLRPLFSLMNTYCLCDACTVLFTSKLVLVLPVPIWWSIYFIVNSEVNVGDGLLYVKNTLQDDQSLIGDHDVNPENKVFILSTTLCTSGCLRKTFSK
jgi:hypothetical protein